jgi:hypothetical protein
MKLSKSRPNGGGQGKFSGHGSAGLKVPRVTGDLGKGSVDMAIVISDSKPIFPDPLKGAI